MENNEKEAKSWWSTIPGTITAIATLITAIGGLIVILQATGVFKSHSSASNANIPDNGTVKSVAQPERADTAPVIHLDSKLIIRHPYSYDLDAGVPYRTDGNSADVDFEWAHPTSMDYEIRPDLGKFSLLGKVNFDDIDLSRLEKLQYSKDPINSDLLVDGAVVAVITKEKRFGKFIVVADGYLEPTIRLVVYENK